MAIDDGGPAFPTTLACDSVGLTKRDWFAGQALVGFLSHGQRRLGEDAEGNPSKYFGEELSEMVYCVADAMIAARKAENG